MLNFEEIKKKLLGNYNLNKQIDPS